MRVNAFIITFIFLLIIGSLIILVMIIMGKEPKFLQRIQASNVNPVREHEKRNDAEIERIRRELRQEGGKSQ
ncbi:MAG: hypothetical protein RMJ67_01135 [Elusimicrobiota bacterium]|nr:hypothetical protein [Endomicrobiia bacterium]MDW8165107.1 hypothetical protein [Elusimicrobiota bacterium]